ncbi:hypothetical protein N0V92_010873 [Colletotrichum tropicale]|nr:hypothetical protein N0V92_010873 [Colletotrichum tropicale]
MPNEDRPNILAPRQPPRTFARLRAKAFADRERKAKEEEEEAKKNKGQQNGEEQTKESSSSSASAPESKPRVHPSLFKPRTVFPGTMNIAILNDDWTLPLDQVDLKEQFQYKQEQQGREEASESAAGSNNAAIGGAETKSAQ